MENYLNEYPPHIKYLIDDLESSQDAVNVLSKYISTLPSDPVLKEIYQSLGYSETTESFNKALNLTETISSLKNYYNTIQNDYYEYMNDSWDVTRGIKEEFLKTFYDNKLQDLSEAFDLGLYDFEPDDNSLNSLWATPPVKKVTESISTDESTPRHGRGLKLLTSKVKHIIYSKGFFSYKEVSDELVKELEISDGLDRIKEEKNILRRVYDALNVLIASEVVVKKGKKYVWHHSINDQNDLTKKQIKKQTLKNQEKKVALQELITKYTSMNQLLNRNKQNPDQDTIPFPFIIIATEEHPDNSVKMQSNPSHTEICMKFKKEIQLYGDIEVLMKLKISSDYKKLPSEVQNLLKITC
ncbi:hypothetical protein SteCoe_18316 [Stentor coeruleus]|uniref:E2F/DP family winged-helix DNA-binding domain-containing protein n=1 Tax=Stentor coeruleus TaxID=5963 RepID=A0A1R2BWS2_9CILI|nr:hypothetical protein SteCoe_18316 [Stentor coeruleus]